MDINQFIATLAPAFVESGTLLTPETRFKDLSDCIDGNHYHRSEVWRQPRSIGIFYGRNHRTAVQYRFRQVMTLSRFV